MVEPGDTVSATLKKEFGEEAMNSMEAPEAEKKVIKEHIDHLFNSGVQVRAYSDLCGKYAVKSVHICKESVFVHICS